MLDTHILFFPLFFAFVFFSSWVMPYSDYIKGSRNRILLAIKANVEAIDNVLRAIEFEFRQVGLPPLECQYILTQLDRSLEGEVPNPSLASYAKQQLANLSSRFMT